MKKYLIALVMIVMIMSCFFGKTLVMANEDEDDAVYNRYYTTIEVEKGDTLWSVAKTYYHHSGMSVREYVYELKLINGMVSDERCPGILFFLRDTCIPADRRPKVPCLLLPG